MSSERDPEFERLLNLARLEAMAREASSEKELHFLIVNETRRLFEYRQAVLVALPGGVGQRGRVEAVSSLVVVDPNSPFVRWVSRAAPQAIAQPAGSKPVRLTSETLSSPLDEDAAEFAPGSVLVCPMRLANGAVVGALWLVRDAQWTEHEITLAGRLADAYAHAWCALTGRHRIGVRGRLRGVWPAALALAFAAALFIPVPLTTLAPAEIVAREPTVVSAPMDGVIDEILIAPNSEVLAGEPVLRFENTRLRSHHEVAEKALAVAEAGLRTATQGAFADPRRTAEVALLQAQVDLSRAERDYAGALLEQVEVRAPIAGLLLYSDPQDWVGRPVSVGERIMIVADPSRIELLVELPVADAIVLSRGARVQLFLDIDPLEPREARIEHFGYDAVVTAAEVLAYRVHARFDEHSPALRIGLRGTAKVHGEKVSLGFLLFRRPISALRQRFGF